MQSVISEADGKAKVALVKCTSYEQKKVDEALAKAVGLLGGLAQIFGEDAIGADDGSAGGLTAGGDAGTRVSKTGRLVLKPNLLAKNPPERACTTHPAVFKAAGKLLQQAGYENLTYGDSPGNPMTRPEKVAEECGIKAAADELGIPFGKFESGTGVRFPKGEVCNHFILCDEIIEADGIINICKMKTHQLERVTGAVKNTFGCVFGVNKGAFHAQFSTAETFADMIADLNSLVKPKLHIMDGITAMEGNGPQSGKPKAMNVILVSTDPVAMDTLFCHLVDLRPELAPTNVSGERRGIGVSDPAAIDVMTEEGLLTLEEAGKRYGDPGFDVQRDAKYNGVLRGIGFIVPYLEKKPAIRKERCVGCGICVDSCPLPEKAIGLPAGRRAPVYDHSKCIKCWCCQEMCPKEAIIVKGSPILRLAELLGMM